MTAYGSPDWPASPPLSALVNGVHHTSAEHLLSLLPDASIDLIATDPPYNGVKDDAWDNQWATDADFLAWLDGILREYKRVLKPNGSLYLFASPRMAARVEITVQNHFNVLNSIRWVKDAGWQNRTEKEAMRGYFPANEVIIFAEQHDNDQTGLEVILNDFGLFKSVRDYFWQERQKLSHLSYKQINQAIGTADNGGGVASNMLNSWKLDWTFPRRETYELMAKKTGICQRPFDDLQVEYERLRREYDFLRLRHEAERRPFNITAADPFTDTWTFRTVQPYDGKHPAEKPLDMMRHIVRASSRPGAVVLDTFAGSGTTLDAARREGRQFIGCDFDTHWSQYAARRVMLPFTLGMFDTLEVVAS